MKTTGVSLREMAAECRPEIQEEVRLTMSISDRLECLMRMRGITKTELARALDKRPSEITRWLSGQHNFTLRTLAMLSVYFGASLIEVAK